jgi:hypothetical protein
VGVEGVGLKDHGDVAIFGGNLRHVPIPDVNPPLGDLLQPGQQPQGGRLAATGGADQHQELAVRDVKGQVLHRDHVPELLGDMLKGHARHGIFPLLSKVQPARILF